jgi:hypothetical protein
LQYYRKEFTKEFNGKKAKAAFISDLKKKSYHFECWSLFTCHDITEILLKVAVNNINITLFLPHFEILF